MFFVAAISFVTIAWSTIAYQERRLTTFEEALPLRLQELSLDSLSRFDDGEPISLIKSSWIQSPQYPITLVFWAPWSGESIEVLRQEALSSTTLLIALAVKDSKENVQSVLDEITKKTVDAQLKAYDGTPLYQSWELPGVPTVIHLESSTRGVFVVGTKRDSIAFTLPEALSL